MSSLYYKKLQKQLNPEASSSDDSDSDEETVKKAVKQTKKTPAIADSDDLFVIDGNEALEAPKEGNFEAADLLSTAYLEPYEMDKDLKDLLEKAVVGPKFENNYQPQARLLGRNAAMRLRKAEREKTKGKAWFDLPATELTDEAKRDLEMLQMRSALDPLAHYKRNDRAVLPKYFQVGRVVDAPEDFYSSRMLKKERKKTMVDELLHNEESLSKAKKKYAEIRENEVKKRRGAFQRFGARKSHKQQREAKMKNKRK
uniref:Fcf2 domain-containing protein n=1 Tax=Caenorhabditis japonica TaxID=281687 RepID=A0A8R1I3E0_CAEJA